MAQPDLTIETESGAVGLSLTRAHVMMHATDALKQTLRDETATDSDLESLGLAGRFARFVTGSVRGLLEQIRYPLADIEAVIDDGERSFLATGANTRSRSSRCVRNTDRRLATFRRATLEPLSRRSTSGRLNSDVGPGRIEKLEGC